MRDHMVTCRNSRILVVHSTESEADAFARAGGLIADAVDAAKFAGRSCGVVATNFCCDFEGNELVYSLQIVLEEVPE